MPEDCGPNLLQGRAETRTTKSQLHAGQAATKLTSTTFDHSDWDVLYCLVWHVSQSV
jgi:hypothetical protein